MINKNYLFIILMSIFINAYALNDDVKTDILMEKITSSIKENRFNEALPSFKELEAIGKPLPESFYYYYIEALEKSGDTLNAYDRAETYLANYGKNGKYYGKVVGIFARLEGPAAKIRAEALRKSNENARAQLKYESDKEDYKNSISYLDRNFKYCMNIANEKGPACYELADKKEGFFGSYEKAQRQRDYCYEIYSEDACMKQYNKGKNALKVPVSPHQ